MGSLGELEPPDHRGLCLEDPGIKLTSTLASYVRHLERELAQPPTTKTQTRHNVAEKSNIIALCNKVIAMVMDPEMYLFTTSLQFHFCSCLKTAVDLRVHEHIPRHGAISVQQLAGVVGADEKLLRRIMRMLVNKSIFAEPEPGHYAHTPVSLVICRPNMPDLLSHRLEDGFRAASRHAEALAKLQYRDPTAEDILGFQLAFSTPKNYWDYVEEDDPDCGQRFSKAMRAVTVNKLGDLPKLYPFNELVDDGGLIIDVGGGMGQVAQSILSHWPRLGLKCIVQDKFASKSDSTHADLEMQSYDFFSPQPIKGAAAYLFRHIFHDWPDDACVKILKNTVEAIDPQRSRILICDQIMEERNPSTAAVLYDIDMMSLYGGQERTLSEWEALLKAADQRLQIKNVFRSPNQVSGILEVQLCCD
ncbi:O-methyltransferase-domain-containing protein [Aspergillus bertholletiae]|uniref:O-methyltransferase-domain-containing protein n=1 Tax=Aspergillus bertholletiae TaxID=1226010 RepID=A0A5N7B8L8_9EURO|nr:O-methyltransferase-domain-containing protein [Aspergillus bertholletiae]